MSKLINGNPDYKVVEELALEFLAISLSQEEVGQEVVMGNPNVNREYNFCGSPACHAGWYAAYRSKGKYTSYSEGEIAITNKLGFKVPIFSAACLPSKINDSIHFSLIGINFPARSSTMYSVAGSSSAKTGPERTSYPLSL